ncbi:MAG TPA: shikimate kinase [Candidatus Sulfotelmatobacter sp.]
MVGFMGAGKSTVGRALGKYLGWAFEDLDERIELDQGRLIAEIFSAKGEAEFRRLETEALRILLQELTDGGNRVIGLGGGAFVQAQNAALLKEAGVHTVFLNAPPEELWRRCVEQTAQAGISRPLLQSFEQFHALFLSRQESYEKASIHVATKGREVDAIAQEISEMIVQKKLR